MNLIIVKIRLLLVQIFLKNLIKDEKGQTLTEYVLAVIFIAFAGFVLLRLFPDLIREYVDRIFFWVSLPIP
jgi:hypothetical protein